METLLIHPVKEVPISANVRGVLEWPDLMSTSSSEVDVTKVSAMDIKKHITHEMRKKLPKYKHRAFTTSAKFAACTTKKVKGTNK